MVPGMTGGLQASSSASSGQDIRNDISTGTISVGGLTMGGKSEGLQAEHLLLGGAIVAGVLGSLWTIKKIKKS